MSTEKRNKNQSEAIQLRSLILCCKKKKKLIKSWCLNLVHCGQIEAWDQSPQTLHKHYIWTIHVVYHCTDNNEPLSLSPYTRQSPLLIVSSPWVSVPYWSFPWSILQQGQSEERPPSSQHLITYYAALTMQQPLLSNKTANNNDLTHSFGLTKSNTEFGWTTIQKCPFLWSRIVMNESMWD